MLELDNNSPTKLQAKGRTLCQRQGLCMGFWSHCHISHASVLRKRMHSKWASKKIERTFCKTAVLLTMATPSPRYTIQCSAPATTLKSYNRFKAIPSLENGNEIERGSRRGVGGGGMLRYNANKSLGAGKLAANSMRSKSQALEILKAHDVRSGHEASKGLPL